MSKFKEAESFAKQHLSECCKELIEWQNTSILVDGKARELAQMLEFKESTYPLVLAKSIIERLAIEQVARRAEPERVSRMDVLSLSEAARCLGVAQAKNDADAIASWKAESLRLESAICAKAEPEKVERVAYISIGNLDYLKRYPQTAIVDVTSNPEVIHGQAVALYAAPQQEQK